MIDPPQTPQVAQKKQGRPQPRFANDPEVTPTPRGRRKRHQEDPEGLSESHDEDEQPRAGGSKNPGMFQYDCRNYYTINLFRYCVNFVVQVLLPEEFDLDNVSSGSDDPPSPLAGKGKSKAVGLKHPHIPLPQTPHARKAELATATGPAGNKATGAQDVNTFISKDTGKQVCIFCTYVSI